MPKLIVLLIVAVASLLFFKASSQPLDPEKELTQYSLDQWKDEQAPSSIMRIIQTSDGYLWIATLKGIARFDGVKITIFDKFTHPELKVNGFKSLYEDLDKNLWIGSIGGGLFLKNHNNFRQFQIPFGPSSNNIERIKKDKKNNLWLCTLRGLVLFQDSSFTLIKAKGIQQADDYVAFDIAEDPDGKIWVATSHGLFTLENNLLIPFETSINMGEIIDLQFDNENTLWLASYSYGIFQLKNNQIQKISTLDFLNHPIVFLNDRNGNMWIGSEHGVARWIDGKISSLETSKGLSHNHVTALCEDHEGSMWLGTYYGGINHVRDGAFTNFTTIHGLPHNTVHTIAQDADGTIWAGTETDLAFLDSNNIFHKLSDKFPVLRNIRVRDIHFDKQGNMWISSYDGVFKIANNKIESFTTANGLSSNQARTIYEDKNGAIWIGTRQGLNKYENGKWKNYSNAEGLTNEFVVSICERQSGQLLIGTTGGVFTLIYDHFEKLKLKDEGLSATTFFVYEDADQNIWTCTTTGLILLRGNTAYNFSGRHKFLGSNIYQVIEDNAGDFWLSSDIGIGRVNRQHLIDAAFNDTMKITIRIFDKSSGLRTNETTAASTGMKARDGRIWFPTLEGVSCIDPVNIKINQTPAPITIEKIMIAGKEYPYEQNITVPANSKNIEIHYTGLSYMIPKKVKFKFKLEGYDEKWIDAGERRVAYYSSLPPGEFYFNISASNNDGIWNTVNHALTFNVQRAFWQTVPFYIFSSVIFIILIAGIIHFRTRSVKLQNIKLERIVRERTAEVLQQKEEIESQRDYIETKNIELEKARNLISLQYEKLREINENLELKVEDRTRELKQAYQELMEVNKELDDFVYKSAHDIKGPLARLQGLCHLALMEAGQIPTREYLLKLQHESMLANRVIEKLAHTYEVKHHAVEFSTLSVRETIEEVIRHLSVNFSNELKSINIIIMIDHGLRIQSDKRLLSEVFSNILENSIVFKNENSSEISITASQLANDFVISIHDNGIGMEDSVKADIFKMFVKGTEKSQGLGLGLYIASLAIDQLNGTIQLIKGEPGNTQFDIHLPITETQEFTTRKKAISV